MVWPLSGTAKIHDMYRFLILIRWKLEIPTLEGGMQENAIQLVREPANHLGLPAQYDFEFSTLRVYVCYGENILYWYLRIHPSH